MKNWLGQDVNVGDYVYRGGRDGNSSSFKAGRVKKVSPSGRVTVNWLVEPMSIWLFSVRDGKTVQHPISRTMNSSGTSDLNTMIVVRDALVNDAIIRAEIYGQAKKVCKPVHHANQFRDLIELEEFEDYVNNELAIRGITV